jgi:hypothetical protein
MLKEQTKVYLGEEGFCLGPSIAEVDPRADYVREVTSRLDGVNPGEIPKGPPRRDKVYKRPCICENKSPRVESNPQVPVVEITMGITCGKR